MAKKIKQKKEDFFEYIPDMPCQMMGLINNLKNTNMNEQKKEIKEDSEEVKLLKKILYIQHNGGWGRHLDQIIYDRLKLLENEQ